MKNSTLTFILLSFLMGIPTIFAQKEINISSKNHSIHSFDLVANLVLVEGTLHKEAGWFILDTGMPDLILNKRYFYSGTSTEQFVSLSGKTTKVSKPIVSFSLGILKCNNKEVIALSMPQLERKTNRKILGLIGHRLLKNKEVIIDYDQSIISFYNTQKNGATKVATHLPPPVENLPFKWKGHIPYITLQWQKDNLNFGIDTGASINLIDQKHDDKLSHSKRPSILLVNVGNTRSSVTYSAINQLTVQQKPFPAMRMATYDLTALNQQLAGKKMDGILGYQFLRRQRVAINYRNKTLSLWRPSSDKERLYVKMEDQKVKLRMLQQ